MSNVRSLNTEVHARQAVACFRHRAALVRSYERQQEVVRETRGRRVAEGCKPTNPLLGRPSVGGLLTVGGARSKSKSAGGLNPSRPSSRCNATQGRLTSRRKSASPSAVPFGRSVSSAARSGARQGLQRERLARCYSRPCGVPQRRCSAGYAGAGEYARAKWRRHAPAARMLHAPVAGI